MKIIIELDKPDEIEKLLSTFVKDVNYDNKTKEDLKKLFRN